MGSRTRLILDLDDDLPADFETRNLTEVDLVVVRFRYRFIGSANSYLDICVDLLEASWLIEQLGAHAREIRVSQGRERYHPSVTVFLRGAQPGLAHAIADGALLLNDDGENDDAEAVKRLDALQERVDVYEEQINDLELRAPAIAGDYLANLMTAYSEWRSEAPDYVQAQFAQFPERRLGFYRSPSSRRYGGACYASREGWILDRIVNVDRFFMLTGQAYRSKDFRPAEVLSLGHQTVAAASNLLVAFPMAQYVRSVTAARLARDIDGDPWLQDPFAWRVPGDRPAFPRPGCLVHRSGALIIVEDADVSHLLYDTAPLNRVQVETLLKSAAHVESVVADAAGLVRPIACPWSVLTDAQFEDLCYDLIRRHPTFDPATIRKLGKTRSRDGGRDIEVHERRRGDGREPRKWIFQCKLVTDGSSLGARRVIDVGDMLQQYGARGFGVMTSTAIDATLYDKLSAVCRRRQVREMHYSVLELERDLADEPILRRRYFGNRA